MIGVAAHSRIVHLHGEPAVANLRVQPLSDVVGTDTCAVGSADDAQLVAIVTGLAGQIEIATFDNGNAILAAVVRIVDSKRFAAVMVGVAAHGRVVHLHGEPVVADLRVQTVGDVIGTDTSAVRGA